MRTATVTDRLAGLGGSKWAVHMRARALAAAGHDIIELTIGEPDVPAPPALVEATVAALRDGRTGYSNGRGEPALLEALAARYTARRGRTFGPGNFLCFPGTQTALYAVLTALVEAGDAVIVGDPMYATYAGLVAATGARLVPVPLRAGRGFRLDPADVAAAVAAAPEARVLFLNTPHNPTGAVLTPGDLAALGAIARARDLWILCDEVYEDLVFPGVAFASPLDDPALADRVIVTNSISKSHAAPGFRAGWCAGPDDFCARLLPLAETMLFGNQPFIADAAAAALAAPSPVAAGMAARFAARAGMVRDRLDGVAGLRVHVPEAGMFALIDVRASGMTGEGFAAALLEAAGVAVMPGESFGAALAGWVRVALTQPDGRIAAACDRIAAFAAARPGAAPGGQPPGPSGVFPER